MVFKYANKMLSRESLIDLASKENDPAAQYCLGLSYLGGEDNAVQDFSRAAFWLAKAAAQQLAGAKSDLEQVFDNKIQTFEPRQINPELLIKAARDCNDIALMGLCWMAFGN